MYALHNHLKITRPKIAHRDTLRELKHRELWTGDGETKHAPLRFADLQQNRGYGGRREGGSERFTRRRGPRWALREVLTARFVSTGYENPLLHPRPPGPSRSKEAFSPLAPSLQPRERPYPHAPHPFTPFPSPLAGRGGDSPSLASPPHAGGPCPCPPLRLTAGRRLVLTCIPGRPVCTGEWAMAAAAAEEGRGGAGGSRVSSGGSRGTGLSSSPHPHTHNLPPSRPSHPPTEQRWEKRPSQARALQARVMDATAAASSPHPLLFLLLPRPRAQDGCYWRGRAGPCRRHGDKRERSGGGTGEEATAARAPSPPPSPRLPARTAPPAPPSAPPAAMGERGKAGKWKVPSTLRPYVPRGVETRRPWSESPERLWGCRLPGAALASSSGRIGGGARTRSRGLAGFVGFRPSLYFREDRPAARDLPASPARSREGEQLPGCR